MHDSTPDHLDRPLRGGLMVADRPATAAATDASETARTIVGRLLARVAAEPTRADDAGRACLRLAIEMLHAHPDHDRTAHLRDAARGWARTGVSLDVLDTLHAAAHEVLARLGRPETASARPHYDVVVAATRLVTDLMGTMSTTIIGAFVRQFDGDRCDEHSSRAAALSALLRGQPAAEIEARYGIAIAERYHVLALAARPNRQSDDEETVGNDLRAQRLRHALSIRTGSTTLSALSATGGTILLPPTETTSGVEHLVAEIGRAAGLAVSATLVEAAGPDIAAAVERAHELLDIVQRLDLPRGLYGFDELALEYQLTRPGPALTHLRALLAPLDDHPELLTTLRCHIAANLNRQRTGKTLHLHPNTVDYRLRRIAELTGFHAHRYPDLWYLRSALVVHSVQPDLP
ncbi:PucR family transcriptional regulator [Nocardia veterana]|uniref:PucR family transcriptional regulator n=1 Tax=Nocardia veterana TaxID=132249 RepID=A0A7X6RJZ5_9NOCA|nr:helix-turn-helix domain-containing protein [Nocardia veterana]NKY88114.1 PucR family transcriptional regulator [Nocardia veterana]